MLKKIIATAAVAVTGFVGISCTSTASTTDAESPAAVTTVPDKPLIIQMDDAGIFVEDITESTMVNAANRFCREREEGITHEEYTEFIQENISEWWQPVDAEKALAIWYANYCPELYPY